MTRTASARALVGFGSFLWFAVASASGTLGQTPTRTLPPTPLEAFAAQPTAHTTWSKFIGRLDGGTASAIVTAIALSDESMPPNVMRGVRIELRHEGPRPSCDLKHVEWSILCARENASVYLDESRLESIRASVLQGNAEIRPGWASGIVRFGGSNGSGTLIGGYLLYEVTPQAVASSLADAAAKLKTAPK